HLCFRAMCKDEDAMAITPPIIDDTTPFRTRRLIEWVVSLGVFLLAAMFIAFYDIPWGIDIMPRSPFLFTLYLTIIATFTAGVATFNVRVPVLRLPTTLLAVIALIAGSLYYSYHAMILDWSKSQYPFHAFFDSTASWPVVLIVMLLGFCLFVAILLTLALGALYLRRLAAGKPQFFRQKTLAVVYGSALATVLLTVTLTHSSFMNRYFRLHILVRKDIDLSVEHTERMIGLANAIVHHSNSQRDRTWALHIRGEMLLRAGRYDEAIVDFDESLESDIWSQSPAGNTFRFYMAYYRGVARLLQGDDAAALADFDLAERIGEDRGSPIYFPELFYHRAVAKERLGDLPGAVADYSRVIENLEILASPPNHGRFGESAIYSAIQRPESANERTLSDVRSGDLGYKITLDGLRTIRDRLSARSIDSEDK
ncbi:MAG: hypothetical protein FWD31_14365, partial [Planctomycetaceae bacterium]|nr:hypothetical protein [Planctomycetaceae bacterium]